MVKTLINYENRNKYNSSNMYESSGPPSELPDNDNGKLDCVYGEDLSSLGGPIPPGT